MSSASTSRGSLTISDWLLLREAALRIHSATRCVYLTFDELQIVPSPPELRLRVEGCIVCGRVPQPGDVAEFLTPRGAP